MPVDEINWKAYEGFSVEQLVIIFGEKQNELIRYVAHKMTLMSADIDEHELKLIKLTEDHPRLETVCGQVNEHLEMAKLQSELTRVRNRDIGRVAGMFVKYLLPTAAVIISIIALAHGLSPPA